MLSTHTRPAVTIEGDHQTGKTEALIRIAVGDAALGRRVLYATDLWSVARNTAHRTRDAIEPSQMVRTRDAAGNQRIELASGGQIIFITGNSPTAHRGIECDTLILDDAHAYEANIDSLGWCNASADHPRTYIARLG